MVGADPACFLGDHRRAVPVLRNTQSIGPRRTIGETELDANAEARGRATPRQFPQNRSQSVPRFYYLLKRFMQAVDRNRRVSRKLVLPALFGPTRASAAASAPGSMRCFDRSRSRHPRPLPAYPKFIRRVESRRLRVAVVQ